MNLTYVCIPALVLLSCLAETYRIIKTNYLGKYIMVQGRSKYVPKHWFTAQEKHTRLIPRAVACLFALALCLVVWLKLAVAQPDLPAIFNNDGAGYTLAISALGAILLWRLAEHINENLCKWYDLIIILLGVALPFAANATLFTLVHILPLV